MFKNAMKWIAEPFLNMSSFDTAITLYIYILTLSLVAYAPLAGVGKALAVFMISITSLWFLSLIVSVWNFAFYREIHRDKTQSFIRFYLSEKINEFLTMVVMSGSLVIPFGLIEKKGIIFIWLVFVIVYLCENTLLIYRVEKDLFGKNAPEIKEIYRFISKHRDGSSEPPGNLGAEIKTDTSKQEWLVDGATQNSGGNR